MNGDTIFLISVISIAAACVVAVIVLTVRHYLRTRRLPYELTHVDQRPLSQSIIYVILMSDILFRTLAPKSVLASTPTGLVLAGVDLSLCAAFLAVAVVALSWCFHDGWNRQTGLWQTFHLMLAAAVGAFVCWDIQLYAGNGLIWIIAGLEACFLIPVFTRLAYVEYYLRRVTASRDARQP